MDAMIYDLANAKLKEEASDWKTLALVLNDYGYDPKKIVGDVCLRSGEQNPVDIFGTKLPTVKYAFHIPEIVQYVSNLYMATSDSDPNLVDIQHVRKRIGGHKGHMAEVRLLIEVGDEPYVVHSAMNQAMKVIKHNCERHPGMCVIVSLGPQRQGIFESNGVGYERACIWFCELMLMGFYGLVQYPSKFNSFSLKDLAEAGYTDVMEMYLRVFMYASCPPLTLQEARALVSTSDLVRISLKTFRRRTAEDKPRIYKTDGDTHYINMRLCKPKSKDGGALQNFLYAYGPLWMMQDSTRRMCGVPLELYDLEFFDRDPLFLKHESPAQSAPASVEDHGEPEGKSLLPPEKEVVTARNSTEAEELQKDIDIANAAAREERRTRRSQFPPRDPTEAILPQAAAELEGNGDDQRPNKADRRRQRRTLKKKESARKQAACDAEKTRQFLKMTKAAMKVEKPDNFYDTPPVTQKAPKPKKPPNKKSAEALEIERALFV